MPINDSTEINRDAKAYFRWLRAGKMTLAEARAEILVSQKQLELLQADSTEMTLKVIITRRSKTWAALMQIILSEASRLPAPGVCPKPRRAKAASA